MSVNDPLFDADQPKLALLGARATDPETSHMAAFDVDGPGDRERAFAALSQYGPQTDFELAERIERQQTSAGKRRHELMKAGLVKYSGEKRPSPSGSLSRVWMLTDRGLELAASGHPVPVASSCRQAWSVET